MDNEKEYINRVFRLAMAAGLCNNQKELADLLNINKASLSGALNGRPANLTPSMIKRFQRFAAAHNLEASPFPQPAKPSAAPEVDELLATIASQQRTIERLTQILAAQTGAAIGAPIAAAAQKNWQPTKKEI